MWEFVMRGGVEILPVEKKVLHRCRELMDKYHDLPMDLADATLVSLSEETGVSKIFTFDHKDFAIYRPFQKRRLHLIPQKL